MQYAYISHVLSEAIKWHVTILGIQYCRSLEMPFPLPLAKHLWLLFLPLTHWVWPPHYSLYCKMLVQVL